MKLSEKEKQRLQNQYGPWAVVTGATSGIGKALAETLASAGLHLLIHARNEEELLALQHRWQQQYGIRVKTVAADLSEPVAVDAVIKAVAELKPGLAVLSAGFGTSGAFLQSSLHTEINMLRVNCEAVLSLTHYFSQRFAAQKKGGIILLSSLVAFQGVPYAANYAATKAWVQSFAEALAVELKPHGVDVLSAAPGPVNSGFARRANMQMGKAMLPEKLAIPVLKALGRKTHVVPGLLSKLLTYSLRTLPRFAKIKVMKKIMGGFTLHQR